MYYNRRIYEYREAKENLFTSFQTLNKEAFIIILGKIWEKWASAESIVKVSKCLVSQNLA